MTPTRATLDLLASRKSLPRGCVRRFALARILGETLWLPNSQAGIITRERTGRQKRNRAFAAELLAPAAQLMTRIQLDEITSEEVKDLAEEFSVSAFVIENQIRHHQLAIISG
jgi:Zn-dependent peptidase ImmA (M78 family)